MAALLILLSIIPAILFQTWTAQQLCIWFIYEPFNVDPLNFWHITALMVMIKYCTFSVASVSDNRDQSEKVAAYVGIAWLYPMFVLAAGFMLHLLMVAA